MITIRVPATSANLGAGFDCMGLAVPLFNEIRVTPADRLVVHTDAGLPTDERNLVVRSMYAAFERMKRPRMPVELWQINRIPATSGLGSSAACIVAGILAANRLSGDPLDTQGLLNLATELDGHPDNVVPALLGGIVASAVSNGKVEPFRVPNAERWRVALVTPDFPLSTKKSRAALPKHYSRKDVVFTLSHAVTTYAAFAEGDPVRLGAVLADILHEPYRFPLIAGAESIRKDLLDGGAYAVYLSGAGPTMAAFVPESFNYDPPAHWTCRVFHVSPAGAQVEDGR